MTGPHSGSHRLRLRLALPFGWRIVAAAFVILFTAYGAQYCFGVFFNALLEEFRWSRASLAGAFSLYVFGYCVSGFPAGRLSDRLGPRRVIAAGGLLLGGAMASMALVHALWQPYVVYGVVAALGMGTAYVPCNSTVVKWFSARRGLAMGLANTGASAGTLVLPPVAQLAVSGLGWRGAYVVFGLVVLLVVNAVAPLMRRDPASLGLHPDGAPEPPPAARAAGGGLALGAALRSGAFWLLGAAYTATWLPVFIPLVHLVPFARDLGHPPLAAASAISAIGAGAVIGRLVMGWLSDRIGRRTTIAISMLLQAAAFLAFTGARDLPALYATAFLFGYSYGAITTLFPAIVGDFFGHEQAGTLVGFLFMVAGSTSAWGPLAAGAVYDATGTYRPAWLLSAACNVVAFMLVLACRPPGRRHAEARGGGSG
ncbi:MAG TPA: MFS transporter [Candidatus Binatia bacterium]|nr:MFS transporter [Candidatus Binatia bacterium]